MQSDSNLTIGYHYDHEHKYFDGEIPVQYDPFNPKKFILPDNVTLKAPPPTPEGYIAVYDETRNLWKVVPDTFNRTVLFRITYRHNDNDFPQGIPQISTKIASGTFLNLGENKLRRLPRNQKLRSLHILRPYLLFNSLSPTTYKQHIKLYIQNINL